MLKDQIYEKNSENLKTWFVRHNHMGKWHQLPLMSEMAAKTQVGFWHFNGVEVQLFKMDEYWDVKKVSHLRGRNTWEDLCKAVK